jgi:multiple sugar transport system ATP-binding protein
MTMGDRVAVMSDGELQQVDSPLSLHDRPANPFVAGFIGSPQMNLLPGRWADGAVAIGQYQVPVVPIMAPVTLSVTVGVRPEAWRLVAPSEPGLRVDVDLVEELGSDAFVYGTTDIAGVATNLTFRVRARQGVRMGGLLHVATDPGSVHLFDTGSGQRLRI